MGTSHHQAKFSRKDRKALHQVQNCALEAGVHRIKNPSREMESLVGRREGLDLKREKYVLRYSTLRDLKESAPSFL